jgi:Domain of unknown function (DUF4203)
MPAAYQVPAAIALVIGGAVACFFGYRLFRVVLSIFGFILGGLMASSLVGPSDATWMIGAWIVGGLVGMALLYAGYYVGVALSGAALGAVLAHLAFSASDQQPPFVIVLVAAVVGAIASMYLQRHVIILFTAFGGAWTLIVGTMALMGNRAAQAAAAGGNVWVMYPLNPAPGQAWLPYAWVILGIIGAAAQLGLAGSGGKIRRKKKSS